MKTRTLLSILTLTLMLNTMGQEPGIEITFSAIDNVSWIQLDSIKVMNRTQGGDTILFWPDTLLNLDNQTSIPKNASSVGNLHVLQNYPNPMVDQTTLSIYIPEKDEIRLIITDILGRIIIKTDKILNKGVHSFRFTSAGENLYFFTAQWREQSSSIKILQAKAHSTGSALLEYTGSKEFTPKLKATENVSSFDFDHGDTLLYIGFANGLQSGLLHTPETSIDRTFQFATNIPCPGTPTIDYMGQTYNTIQIFSQCWFKENLNAGTMIDGDQEMSDDGILEKYCYNNEPDNCSNYGGLYQWDEMMEYSNEQGSQGICPPGWHVPMDGDWNVLEGAVDSQYNIGDQAWDEFGWRGIDAGKNMKTSSGWYDGGNGTDLFGFSAQPSGAREYDGSTFNVLGEVALSWSSTESEPGIVYYRFLFHNDSEAIRGITVTDYGLSIRCLKD